MSTYELQEFAAPKARRNPILATAALSIAGLMIAVGMQYGAKSAPKALGIPLQNQNPVHVREYLQIEDADENGVPDWQDELAKAGVVMGTTSDATSTEPFFSVAAQIAGELYGGYVNLKKYDSYTPARGEELAQTALANARADVPFTPHVVGELSIDDDSSVERVLSYRADMREAVAPMVTGDLPELEYIAQYMSSKDAAALESLKTAAKRYRDAENNMEILRVPKEVAPEHLRVLNAVGSYAAVLDAYVAHPVDGLESVGILKNFNDSEQEMLQAFDALAQYYVRKVATK